MPLSSKEFVISTSELNSQGFRLLTGGVDLKAFDKNPLLLFNHIRPQGNLKNQILPIGHWQNVRIDGDKIIGIPFFDDKDEFAMSIYNKVEGGHIRMCSAGAKPLEISEDDVDMLPDQESPTVTKWSLQEASICDIGANPDSLDVALYDCDDNLITLSDKQFKNLTKKITMNKKTTTAFEALKKAKQLKADSQKAITLAVEKVELALADDTTSEEEKTKLSDEADETKEMSDDDKDAKIESLTTELATLKKQLADMQDEKALADEASIEDKACKLADLGVGLKKLTAAQRPSFIKLAKNDYQAAKDMLDNTKSSVSVKELLSNTGAALETADESKLKTLSAKSWDELFKETGSIEFLKLNAPDVFKAKFKSKFGKDPKSV